MTPEILYWHWIVFGVALILFEIAIPSFTAFWFGCGAVIVGGIVYFVPDISFTTQIVMWSVFSAILTLAWFKYLKPLSIDKTKAGLSLEAIVGEVGQVLSLPSGEKRGTMRFPAPVLGSDEWLFICEDDISIGDRVKVKDVSGNSLIVTKV